MSKNILIISSSPRKGSNSETLAASFAKGAEEAGHKVETVYLREKNYGFCKGCLACLKVGHCVIDDDAVEIAAKMLQRHHTLTNFLVELGVDPVTAEEDACRMEHDISQQTYEAICAHAAKYRQRLKELEEAAEKK